MSQKTKKSKTAKKLITADDLKNQPVPLKELVAYFIGNGDTIGQVLDNLLDIYKADYKFPRDLTDEKAKDILRDAIRTCNPNDKKFNTKKYGAAYREGRLAYVRSLGDNLLRAFDKHIRNLNFALEKTTFDFSKGLTPKEYAAITKDLVSAVSLYQAIADAHQPDSKLAFDIIPALDSQIRDAEKQKALSTTHEKQQEGTPDTRTKAETTKSD